MFIITFTEIFIISQIHSHREDNDIQKDTKALSISVLSVSPFIKLESPVLWKHSFLGFWFQWRLPSRSAQLPVYRIRTRPRLANHRSHPRLAPENPPCDQLKPMKTLFGVDTGAPPETLVRKLGRGGPGSFHQTCLCAWRKLAEEMEPTLRKRENPEGESADFGSHL